MINDLKHVENMQETLSLCQKVMEKHQENIEQVHLEWKTVKVMDEEDPYSFTLTEFWKLWKLSKRKLLIVPLVVVDFK